MTWEILLNAIWHPYARAPSQVAPVAPEEPATHGGEEEAESDTGAGRLLRLELALVFLEEERVMQQSVA